MEIRNVEIVSITPDYASLLLDSYTYERQRRINHHTVDNYAAQMESNKWRPGSEIEVAWVLNGDGTHHGFLVNGQHRLKAIIKSGQPNTFILKHVGCADMNEVALEYGTIDTQKKRGLPDYFRALALAEELGFVSSDVGRMSAAVAVIEEDFTATHSYIANERRLELVRLYADVGVKFFNSIIGAPTIARKGLRVSGALSVALVTLDESARKYGDGKVELFWAGVAFDDGLVIGDPRKTALRHLTDMAAAAGTKRRQFTTEYTSRYIANCFNAWTENRELRRTHFGDATAPIHINGTHWKGK